MFDEDKTSINYIFEHMNNEIVKNKPTDFNAKENAASRRMDRKVTESLPLIDSVINLAIEDQLKWKATSKLERANILYSIFNSLKNSSDYTCIAESFNIYSDLIMRTEELEPMGIVLLMLPSDHIKYFFGVVVSAALAAGCAIIATSSKFTNSLKDFKQSLIKAGLSEGLFSIVDHDSAVEFNFQTKINKIVFFGDHFTAQNIFAKSLSTSFNFFCPRNTSAVLFESCDLSAAVNKIFYETWNSNSDNAWGISTVVVQESIYKKFIDRVKFQLKNFSQDEVKFIFHTEDIIDKVDKLIKKASKSGIQVLRRENARDKEWSPTFLLEYQDQDIDGYVPVIKVLVCRNTKEGVSFLNNARFNLGTSIWTEVISEALEVADELLCNNIWINCHGKASAGASLHTNGLSGNCVFGGVRGIYEYVSDTEYNVKKNDTENNSYSNYSPVESEPKQNYSSMIISAYKAHKKFLAESNKKSYLIRLANKFEECREFGYLAKKINFLSHFGNTITYFDTNNSSQFSCITKELPIGVIAVFWNNSFDNSNENFINEVFVPVITAAIVLGNAIIFVVQENNSAVTSIVKIFNSILPEHLLQMCASNEAIDSFCSSSLLQEIWVYDTSPEKFIKNTKFLSNAYLKHYRINPSISFIHKFCKNKIIWLTKSDRFA